MDENDIEWIKSSKRKEIPIFKGFEFRLSKRSENGKNYWKCIRTPECSVTLVTLRRNFWSSKGEHSHPKDDLKIERKKALDQMKDKVIQNPLKSIPKIHFDTRIEIITDRRASHNGLIEQSIPSFQSSKSSLYRVKKSVFPSNPNSRDQIKIEIPWCRTIEDKNFLLFESQGVNKILIFGTNVSLERLCTSNRVYLDGTFKSAPALFSQLYSFHCKVQNKSFPSLFAFLPNKSSETYRTLIQGIKGVAHNLNLEFNPKEFMIDFEQSMINVLEEQFREGTRIRGCYFHFAQSIWRKVQSLGLKNEYQNNPEFNKFVRRVICLGLAPYREIDNLWCDFQNDITTSGTINQLMDYIVQTWLETDAIFHRSIWNHSDNSSSRTNNDLEGWHNKLNCYVNKIHPNLFELIYRLKEEELNNEIEIRGLLRGDPIFPPRRKYRDLERRYLIQKTFLEEGGITPLQFVDSLKYFINLN